MGFYLNKMRSIKPVFCLLCGLPGTGKTSLCLKLLSKDESELRFLHISYDELIGHLDLENKVDNKWKDSRRDVISLVADITKQLLSGCPINQDFINDKHNFLCGDTLNGLFKSLKTIVTDKPSYIVLLIDDNMHYKSMRKCYYQLATSLGIGSLVLYLHCPLVVCQQRIASRGNQLSVTSKTLAKMSQNMEPPNDSTVPTKAVFLKLDSRYTYQEDSLSKIFKSLEICSKSPLNVSVTSAKVAECVQQKLLTLNSISHQADNSLRKIINKSFQNSNELPKDLAVKIRNSAQQVSEAKKQVLKKVRSGAVNLEDCFQNNSSETNEAFEKKLIELLIETLS